MKNICFLWHVYYPWDVRIEKFVNALKGRYNVCCVCKGRPGRPLYEEYKGISIYRIFCCAWLGSALRGVINAALLFNPVWILKSFMIFRRNKFSLIIARDLPIMWLAILLSKFYNIPLIFDMAENFPEALVAYKNRLYSPFLACGAFLPKLYEKIAANFSARILVVCEEQKQRLVRIGIQEGKIIVVGNTPDLNIPAGASEDVDTQKGKYILYTGKIDDHRGIETAVKALPKIVSAYPHAKLILAGWGKDAERLKRTAADLGVENSVEFLGWVSHEEVYKNIRKSVVCLVPHKKSMHTDTTLPNKLFDYMLYGKPVVASNLVPVEHILKKYECGLIFESGNYDDLAAKVLTLLAGSKAEVLGRNGAKAVREVFNWEVDSSILKNVVRETAV